MNSVFLNSVSPEVLTLLYLLLNIPIETVCATNTLLPAVSLYAPFDVGKKAQQSDTFRMRLKCSLLPL